MFKVDTTSDHAPVIAHHQYYHWLDLLRGLAAIAVFLVHYQQLYIIVPTTPLTYFAAAETQPFYWLLSPLYEKGYLAVQFFWMLSGFVFANTYFDRPTDGFTYTVARFARLYPLHFATLILTASMQVFSYSWFGQFQIQPSNTIPDFFFHIFMAVGWYGSMGVGFNAPIWSVSLELGAYLIFFLILKSGRFHSVTGQALCSIIIIYLMLVLRLPILECLAYFFLGSTLCIMVGNINRSALKPTIAISAILFAGSAYLFSQGITWYTIMLCGSTLILWVGCLDRFEFKVSRHFSPLGKITYSLYLTHVPLQMLCIILMELSGTDRTIVQSPIFFFGFSALAVVVSILVYVYFERPIDRKIRTYAHQLKERRSALPAPPIAAE